MSGGLLLPLIVSITKVIMGLNMSMVLLDKFSKSLLGTSLLLLLSDKNRKFFEGYADVIIQNISSNGVVT